MPEYSKCSQFLELLEPAKYERASAHVVLSNGGVVYDVGGLLDFAWQDSGRTGMRCNHSPQRSLGRVNGIRLGDPTPPSTETYEMEGDHEVPTTGLQLPSEENGDPDQSAA